MKTLLEIATFVVANGSEDGAAYLDYELPGEDHNREVEEIADETDFQLYRDGDSYFVHHSAGMSSGCWEALSTDYPRIWASLSPTQKGVKA